MTVSQKKYPGAWQVFSQKFHLKSSNSKQGSLKFSLKDGNSGQGNVEILALNPVKSGQTFGRASNIPFSLLL
jgi:hypothetical protein